MRCSQRHSSLQGTLIKINIETYINAEALEMVKKKLDSECTNYAIANELLQEILNREDSRKFKIRTDKRKQILSFCGELQILV